MRASAEKLWEWRGFGRPVDTRALGSPKLPEQTLVDEYLDICNSAINIKIRSMEFELIKVKRLEHRCGQHATELWTISSRDVFVFPLYRERDGALLRLVGPGAWPKIVPDAKSFVELARMQGARTVRVEKRRCRYDFLSYGSLIAVEVATVTSPIHITSVSLEVEGDIADAHDVCRSLLEARGELALTGLERLSYAEAIARWR